MPTELLRMIRAILVLPAVSVYLVSCCGCRDGNEDSYSKNEKYLQIVLSNIMSSQHPSQYVDYLKTQLSEISENPDWLLLPDESIDPSDKQWIAPLTQVAVLFHGYEDYGNALFFLKHGLETKREPRGLQLLAELAVILERPELLSNITQAERKELAWKYRAAEQISGGLHKQALATLEPILDTFPERQKTGDFEALSDWLWAWRMHVYAAVRSNNVLAFEKRYDQLYAWAMGEDPATVIRRLQDGELSSSSMFLFEHLGRICLRLYEGNRNQGNDETAEKWRRRGRKVTAAVGKANVLSLVARDYLLPKFEPDGAADAIPSD